MRPGGDSIHRGNEYWEQSRRPWPSLVFLFPLLLGYELGLIWLGSRGQDSVVERGGADDLLRSLLHVIHLDALWWPPVLVVGGLLFWHWLERHPWKCSLETLGGMFAESVLFAFALVLLGQLQSRVFAEFASDEMTLSASNQLTAALLVSDASTLARVLSFVGAGIYEEVIFRLALLPLGTVLLTPTVLPRAWLPAVSALATSILFAAAHHAGPAGEPFELFPFCFRLLAGLFFAALFVLRGFGITAGSHAMYDILVGVLMSE